MRNLRAAARHPDEDGATIQQLWTGSQDYGQARNTRLRAGYLAGRDIVIYSDGTPRRTFCYSADAIIGYYKVLVKGQAGEPYNIGIEKPEISMTELAQKTISTAKDLFDYRGRLIHDANPEGQYLVDNPNRRCPNIDKAREHLGYNPTIHVDEGLRRALIWYCHNQEAVEA